MGDGGQGWGARGIELKEKAKLPQKAFQPLGTIWKTGVRKWDRPKCLSKVLLQCAHFCSTEANIKASQQDHGHYRAYDILKQGPRPFIPNAPPLEG